jgi:uncharacterized membrane protein YcfT
MTTDRVEPIDRIDRTDRTDRLAWLDVAKGACILLVVLHHVVAKYLGTLLPLELQGVAEAWIGVSIALKPLRMPVFFVISGFFAAGAIHRPWRQVARRATSPYYLYVVWLLVYAVVYRVETTTDANRTDDLADLVSELLWAETSMWFLYALAVYFTLAKVLRRLPPAVVLAAATALALWSGWSGIEYNNKVSVLSHFVYFALGAHVPAAVRWCGERSGSFVARCAAAYVVVFMVLQTTGLPWSVTLVGASLVGLPAGLGAMAHVARADRIGAGLAWLGRRTLRIYVLHFAVIAAVYHLPLMMRGTGLGGLVLAAVLPLLLTAAVTGGCLFVYELMVVHGGQHLFRMHPVLDAAHDGVAPIRRRRGRSPSAM